MLQDTADSLLQLLSQSCVSHYGSNLVSLIIYGSVARGTHTYSSDIDILLIVDDLPRGRMNRMRDFSRIEKQLAHELQTATEKGWNVDLSPVIRTPEEVGMGGYLYLDMVDDCLILFDRESFFAKYLEDLRKRLKAYGARKRPWKGGYYWEIKPDIRPGEILDL